MTVKSTSITSTVTLGPSPGVRTTSVVTTVVTAPHPGVNVPSLVPHVVTGPSHGVHTSSLVTVVVIDLTPHSSRQVKPRRHFLRRRDGWRWRRPKREFSNPPLITLSTPLSKRRNYLQPHYHWRRPFREYSYPAPPTTIIITFTIT